MESHLSRQCKINCRFRFLSISITTRDSNTLFIYLDFILLFFCFQYKDKNNNIFHKSYNTVLFCVLLFVVLLCTVVYCFVLFCIVLYCFKLFYCSSFFGPVLNQAINVKSLSLVFLFSLLFLSFLSLSLFSFRT